MFVDALLSYLDYHKNANIEDSRLLKVEDLAARLSNSIKLSESSVSLGGYQQLSFCEHPDEEFEMLCGKYTHARPFTKESLLYREIFEKYYPGQAEMIAGFWMPNKAWKGCDVDDPSARVLSNYGESGK